MTNKQILTKAIVKAEKNGFKLNRYITAQERDEIKALDYDFVLNNWQKRHWAIIFSHDFAKAIWGEIWPEEVVGVKGLKGNFPYWQIELQMMVLEKEPLKYLEKFLK